MNNVNIGLPISEKEYRDMKEPSYSLLSSIAKVEQVDPGKGKYVIGGNLNENIEDLDSVICGKIVDSVITEGKEPDNLIVIQKKPSGKMKDILSGINNIKNLFDNSVDILHVNNHKVFLELCNLYDYKKKQSDQVKIDGVLNYEEYIRTIYNNENKMIVSSFIYNSANKIINNIKEKYDYIVNPKKYDIEILNQVKLTGRVNGLTLKSMLDMILVNHRKKLIVPFDLKSGYYPAEDFMTKSYLGFFYYLQASLYKRILEQNLMIHPLYRDYRVENFQFLYGSRKDGSTDIFPIDIISDDEAVQGFTHDGVKYIGLNDVIDIYKDYVKQWK